MRFLPQIVALSLAACGASSADGDQPQYPQPQYEYQVPQQQAQTQVQPQYPAQTYQQPQTYARQRGRLGVALEPMTTELRAYFGVPQDRGVLVTRVLPGSIAEQAGLQVGDVITMIGDQPVSRIDEMRQALRDRVDTSIQLQVMRRGQQTTITAMLAPRREAPSPNPML